MKKIMLSVFAVMCLAGVSSVVHACGHHQLSSGLVSPIYCLVDARPRFVQGCRGGDRTACVRRTRPQAVGIEQGT